MKGQTELLIIAATGLVAMVIIHLVLDRLGIAFGPLHFLVIIYFTGLTVVLHTWQVRSANTDPQGIVRRFMLALVLKMLLSLAVVALILILLPRSEAVPLAVIFAVCYLVFLAVGSILLSTTLRKGS